jgi:hypothetical protein
MGNFFNPIKKGEDLGPIDPQSNPDQDQDRVTQIWGKQTKKKRNPFWRKIVNKK